MRFAVAGRTNGGRAKRGTVAGARDDFITMDFITMESVKTPKPAAPLVKLSFRTSGVTVLALCSRSYHVDTGREEEQEEQEEEQQQQPPPTPPKKRRKKRKKKSSFRRRRRRWQRGVRRRRRGGRRDRGQEAKRAAARTAAVVAKKKKTEPGAQTQFCALLALGDVPGDNTMAKHGMVWGGIDSNHLFGRPWHCRRISSSCDTGAGHNDSVDESCLGRLGSTSATSNRC